MPDIVLTHYRTLLEAASFAARAHRHQLRKDGLTPYVAHPFRVCLIVRHIFGIDDPEVLMAALLHDTIEDTTIDFDDIESGFSHTLANHVAGLTKDMRLPEAEREAAYAAALAKAPAAVKIAKLADIFDNLMDSHHLTAAQRERGLRRARHYLQELAVNLPDSARGAFAAVEQLLAEVAAPQGARGN